MDFIFGLDNGVILPLGENGCRVILGFRAGGDVSISHGTLTEYPWIDANADTLRTYLLEGIPEGGPYEITLNVGSENVVFNNVYVRGEECDLPCDVYNAAFVKNVQPEPYVLRGLANGMVMQRDRACDRCDIYFALRGKGDVSVDGVDCVLDEANFDRLDRARVFRLRGIPVGGPYSLTLHIGDDRFEYTGIYVGDNWICAGQSNMEACAGITAIDRAMPIHEPVRYLSCDNEWLAATPNLKHYSGVSPAYYFATKLYEYSGVPQGILHYAYGGSPLYTWMPSEHPLQNAGRFGHLLRRAALAGDRVRGVLWYQGCAEAQRPAGNRIYFENMTRLIGGFRDYFGDPKMPFVQAQVCRYIIDDPWEDMDYWWTQMRNKQLLLPEHIPYTDTVTAINAETQDGLHINSAAQRVVGPCAAESAMKIMNSESDDYLAYIRPERVEISDDRVYVKFKNLHGSLCSPGVPNGFAISESEHCLTTRQPYRVLLHGDTAELCCFFNVEELKNMYLFYGFGNTFYCNITDENNRPVPGFGPYPLAGVPVVDHRKF